MSPLLALSGHPSRAGECPLLDQSGRRSILAGICSPVNDPKRTLRQCGWNQSYSHPDEQLALSSNGTQPLELPWKPNHMTYLSEPTLESGPGLAAIGAAIDLSEAR